MKSIKETDFINLFNEKSEFYKNLRNDFESKYLKTSYCKKHIDFHYKSRAVREKNEDGFYEEMGIDYSINITFKNKFSSYTHSSWTSHEVKDDRKEDFLKNCRKTIKRVCLNQFSKEVTEIVKIAGKHQKLEKEPYLNITGIRTLSKHIKRKKMTASQEDRYIRKNIKESLGFEFPKAGKLKIHKPYHNSPIKGIIFKVNSGVNVEYHPEIYASSFREYSVEKLKESIDFEYFVKMCNISLGSDKVKSHLEKALGTKFDKKNSYDEGFKLEKSHDGKRFRLSLDVELTLTEINKIINSK